MTDRAKQNRRRFALLLIACLAVSLLFVAYPLYVIRPFRAQAPRELPLALVLSRFRPAVAIVAALAAILATLGYWRAQPRKWRRVLPAAGAAFAIVLAVLARVNVYEIMFHPLPRPSFTAASETKLDPAEMVLAVRVGSYSRAYPVRGMSYHHIVNDVLGGVALVATY